MSLRRHKHTTRIYRWGEDGAQVLEVFEAFSFVDLDCDMWSTHVLRISFSFESQSAAQLLSLDFIDPNVRRLESVSGTSGLVRKRVLVDESGTTTSFVSDCLGLGWAVPPRSNGGQPMALLFEADGGGASLGACSVILEHWWEARALSRCDE